MSAVAGVSLDQRYEAALSALRGTAGDLADAVERATSYEARGLWILCGTLGEEVATVGVDGNSVVLHQLSGETFAVGEVQSMRVLCGSCRTPRVLIGMELLPKLLHFRCRNERCKRLVYVRK